MIRFASPELYVPQDGSLKLHIDARAYRGDKAIDVSPAQNHGTITGAILKPGPTGQNVFSFDGVDDIITITGHASLDTPTALSVVAWLYDEVSNQNHSINKDDAGSNRCWIVQRETDTTVNFALWNSAGVINQFYTAPNSWVMNKWFLCVCMAEVSGSNILQEVYLDGIRAGTGSSFSGTAIKTITTQNIRIATPSNKKQRLGSVRIYNRALSASEISAIYNAERHLYGR